MRLASLVRSTPLRLALAFAVMVVVAFALTGVGVHKLVEWELAKHQDQSINETYAVIIDSYGDGDLTDLLESVDTNVRATRGLQRIFLVESANGKYLGGNIRSLSAPLGWSEIKGSTIGGEPDLTYRVFTGMVDGVRVAVGVSEHEIDGIQEILTTSLVWATVLVICLAFAGGAGIAIRMQRRLNAVSTTMHAVAQGTLAARVPLMDRGDDIDVLAGDINVALSRLEQTVEGMRQVSADIAHDLKTPLNRLRIAIEDALDREGRGQSIREDLLEASAEADRINETFDALLRISQIEAGSRRARFGPVDLGQVLGTLVDIYRDVAEDAGQTLRMERGDRSLPPILGDKELLTQMFVNLIENAIRHCPTGAVISVWLTAVQDEIRASVADNGPGIPEEEREKVFRRLYRLEKSRTSSGSGLGLSLVKAVAELHGASIELEDNSPGLRIRLGFRAMTPTEC